LAHGLLRFTRAQDLDEVLPQLVAVIDKNLGADKRVNSMAHAAAEVEQMAAQHEARLETMLGERARGSGESTGRCASVARAPSKSHADGRLRSQ
jgi:hypothetical protein